MSDKIKRIGIDARFYGPLGKGLGRYTKEVTDGVINQDEENEYVVFLSEENFDEFEADGERVKKVLVKARWYTLAEQIVVPLKIWSAKVDLMHFPHFNVPLLCPAKFIVTIHDLILTKHPTQRASTLSPFLYKIKNYAYRIVINSAVKKAKKIIAISNFTRNDILEKFKVDPDKVAMTYEGIASKLEEDDEDINEEDVLKKHNLQKPYLMYVGNAYPHKNLEGLLDVFEALSKTFPDIKLVLVGKEDYFYKRVRSYAQKKEFKKEMVNFPGYIPDEELKFVYRNALGYVFPSLFEGFGLPPLEAMTQGCPVVSSNSTCLPEVLGEAAYYFDAKDKNDMEEKLKTFVMDSMLREQLIEKGHKQIEKYSWDDCVLKTLDIYNKVLGHDS